VQKRCHIKPQAGTDWRASTQAFDVDGFIKSPDVSLPFIISIHSFFRLINLDAKACNNEVALT
jgi:hypothetical protein